MERLFKKREDFFQILAKSEREQEQIEQERLRQITKGNKLSRKNQNVTMKTFPKGVVVPVGGDGTPTPHSRKSLLGGKGNNEDKSKFTPGVTQGKKLP